MSIFVWLIPLALAAEPAPPTTIFLVRHAEKTDGTENPNLSPEGLARAEQLGEMLRSAGISAVFSTDLCRTAQTADPLARALGLPLSVGTLDKDATSLDPCDPALTAPVAAFDTSEDHADRVAARIRMLHKGQRVLVVGHSNTVPALLRALGGPSLCPDPFRAASDGSCLIPDDEYDDLFVLTVPAKGDPQLLRLRY